MSGGYSIKVNGGSNNGKYIYGTSGSNKINFGSNPSLNTLSYESNSVKITSNTSVMRFNNNSGQNRFRYFQSSTYTNQQPVQLYKRVHTTQTHTIHFNPNGASGTMGDQTVNEFELTALQNNTFIREGFVFEGWNTAADGSGDYYADGASVRLLDDLTLYAQWNQLFAITLVQANHGSISASASQAFEETEIYLTATPDPCYTLTQWVVTDSQGHAVTVTENHFEMPASDVTVSAVFSYSSQSFVQEYQLVTSVDQLVAGRTYLIVNVANSKALGTTQNTNNRSASSVTIVDGIIPSIDNTVCELTLGGSTGAWTFFDSGWGSNGGYLYAASSNSNYLRTQASNNANGKWSITVGANGVATIQAQGSNTRNLLKYNNSSNIFSCYASGQLDVCLFRRTEISDYPAEQIVELSTGVNWWSTYLDITLDDLKTAISNALGNSGTATIKSQSGSITYSGGQWRPASISFDIRNMYLIQSSVSCEIVLTGMPINTAALEIPIHGGANWIGFPLGEDMSITEAFGSFPAVGDIIKSSEGSTAYTGSGWRGTITTLEPGRGYIYLSNASNTRTFSFPAR